MARITEGIRQFLATDPILAGDPDALPTPTVGLVNGGFYARRIDVKDTPDAWDPMPPNTQRRSIAVVPGAETRDLRVPGVSIATLNCWVRWNDNPTDNDTAEAIITRIVSILNHEVIEDPNTGEVGMLELLDRFTQGDPWLKGGRMCYVRFNVPGMLSGT